MMSDQTISLPAAFDGVAEIHRCLREDESLALEGLTYLTLCCTGDAWVASFGILADEDGCLDSEWFANPERYGPCGVDADPARAIAAACDEALVVISCIQDRDDADPA